MKIKSIIAISAVVLLTAGWIALSISFFLGKTNENKAETSENTIEEVTCNVGINYQLDSIISQIKAEEKPEIIEEKPQLTQKPAQKTVREEIEEKINAAQTDLEEASDLEVIDAETMDIFTRCIYAEVGACKPLAKRLATDIVLNMVDDEHYPDNIKDVICYQGRFSVYPYAMNKIPEYKDMNSYQKLTWKSCQRAIRHELKKRTSYDVMYMKTGWYHNMGKPLIEVSGAYFSTK